jgi:hypothetical protein
VRAGGLLFAGALGLAFAAPLPVAAAGAAQEAVRVPAPLDPREGDARGAWEKAREKAFAPRRIKALYRGEASHTIGTIVRGYLSIFWDGRVLWWRASAPIAGSLRGGRLEPSTGAGGSGPFAGSLTAADAVGALLGALDLPAAEAPARVESDEVVLVLDGAGRTARVDPKGRVLALGFPGGNRVAYEPGSGLPRRIEARGPDGRADLVLETLGPWPEGEPVPGDEAP